MIPNDLINDYQISDRARFLFIYMASKPPDWTFYNNDLTKHLRYTEDTLRKYVNELVEFGWMSKEKQKRVKGKFTANIYCLFGKPKRNSPSRKNTDTKNTNTKNTGTGKKGEVKNKGLSNTNPNNTNSNNIDFNSLKKKSEKKSRGESLT